MKEIWKDIEGFDTEIEAHNAYQKKLKEINENRVQSNTETT